VIAALNTKLLIAIVALLATIAGTAGYIAHVETVRKQIELAREQRQAAEDKEHQKYLDDIKKAQKEQDSTWKDADKAFRSFKLPK